MSASEGGGGGGSSSGPFPVPEAPPLLPTSAPVSSLLPPIPNHHSNLLQHHLQVSIQAQLAALLGGGAPAPLLGVVPPPNPLLAVASTPSVPPNPLLSVGDMHGWSVDQIGTF
jgi:hypothetical protein